MSFYVTVRDSSGRRTVFAAGPFNRHGDALRMVAPVRVLVGELFPDAPWYQYGTSRVKRAPRPGKFNARLGLPTQGRIAQIDPATTQGWWTIGDCTDPVGYLARHGTQAERIRMERHLGRRVA